MRIIANTMLVAGILIASPRPVKADDRLEVPPPVLAVLSEWCIDCHGAVPAEGDVRLDDLADLDLEARLALLNRAQEQLFLEQMPPKDEEQPTAAERTLLTKWVFRELDKHGASTLEQKLKKPEYVNYVDHDKLFSGEYAYLPAITAIMALEDTHHATLAARRAYLERCIAKLCEEIYGGDNESLLPAFAPVVLNAEKPLAKGEKYKKAPIDVAQGSRGSPWSTASCLIPRPRACQTTTSDKLLAELIDQLSVQILERPPPSQNRLSTSVSRWPARSSTRRARSSS